MLNSRSVKPVHVSSSCAVLLHWLSTLPTLGMQNYSPTWEYIDISFARKPGVEERETCTVYPAFSILQVFMSVRRKGMNPQRLLRVGRLMSRPCNSVMAIIQQLPMRLLFSCSLICAVLLEPVHL